jgi:hypothetical protein
MRRPLVIYGIFYQFTFSSPCFPSCRIVFNYEYGYSSV